MDLGLAGKTALVTAASKGLGRAVALALAREGAQVAICSRDGEALRQAAEEIRSATGRDVLFRTADVSRKEDIDALVQAVRAEYGHIDILVSNSGGPPPGRFLELDDGAWQAALDLLLLSAVRLARAVLPEMQTRGWGRLLFVTSGSVKQPIQNLVLSNSIRAAVTGMAKTLAGEVGRYGITVNCLAPGRIDTERVRSLDRDTAARTGKTPEQVRAALESAIPLGRYGHADEFGRVAAFLCSDAASYISGSTIVVDGGSTNTLL